MTVCPILKLPLRQVSGSQLTPQTQKVSSSNNTIRCPVPARASCNKKHLAGRVRLTVVPVAKAAVKNMAHARLLHFEIAFAIFLCLDYAGYAFQNLHAKALKGADLPRIVGLQ